MSNDSNYYTLNVNNTPYNLSPGETSFVMKFDVQVDADGNIHVNSNSKTQLYKFTKPEEIGISQRLQPTTEWVKNITDRLILLRNTNDDINKQLTNIEKNKDTEKKELRSKIYAIKLQFMFTRVKLLKQNIDPHIFIKGDIVAITSNNNNVYLGIVNSYNTTNDTYNVNYTNSVNITKPVDVKPTNLTVPKLKENTQVEYYDNNKWHVGNVIKYGTTNMIVMDNETNTSKTIQIPKIRYTPALHTGGRKTRGRNQGVRRSMKRVYNL